jgi:hypothetical protein
LLVFACACFASPARATILARMSLAELAGAADAIVQVRCLSAAGRWDAGAIWTFTEFAVVEKLDGAVVTQDSSRFAVFDQTTRRFHTEGVRNISLEEFRRRLTAAMAQPATGAAR